MGQRLDKKEIDEIQEQPQVMEVSINLELINNKLNYLITSIDQLKSQILK